MPSAQAATAVDLGSAESYVVLGASTVTNTGTSILNGDLGVAPGNAITGFPPGIVVPPGVIHAADAAALQAQVDLTSAYGVAANEPSDFAITADLGGQTLVAGVYSAQTSAGLTGALTLDGQNDPASVWIFQVGSTLTTASGSSVVLINQAQACNVFWQVGSSATLGTGTDFVGTIMALTSVTLVNGTTVDGRALALNGAVTLDNNVFVDPRCDDDDPDPDADAEADAGADVDSAADSEAGADVDGAVDTDAASDVDAAADSEASADVDGAVDTDAAAAVDGAADATGGDADGADSSGPANAQAATDADRNSGGASSSSGRDEDLAATGFDGWWVMAVGAVLVAAGGVMFLGRRNRAER